MNQQKPSQRKFLIGLAAFLGLGCMLLLLAEWSGESAEKQKLQEERASVEFERRKDEARDAYNSGKINLAEREGLLARIRDEEEKLK